MQYFSILFFGDFGLKELQDLKKYRSELELNLNELKDINKDLKKQSISLINSSESIILRARELGYFQENEEIIMISGYKPKGKYYSIGRILNIEYKENDRENLFLALSGCFGLIFFIASGYHFRRKSGSKEN